MEEVALADIILESPYKKSIDYSHLSEKEKFDTMLKELLRNYNNIQEDKLFMKNYNIIKDDINRFYSQKRTNDLILS